MLTAKEVLDVSHIIDATCQLPTLAKVVDTNLDISYEYAIERTEEEKSYTQGFLLTVTLRILEERLYLSMVAVFESGSVILLLCWGSRRRRTTCHWSGKNCVHNMHRFHYLGQHIDIHCRI